MNLSDLSQEHFTKLVNALVDDRLCELLGDPDLGLPLDETVRARLKESLASSERMTGIRSLNNSASAGNPPCPGIESPIYLLCSVTCGPPNRPWLSVFWIKPNGWHQMRVTFVTIHCTPTCQASFNMPLQIGVFCIPLIEKIMS